MAQRKIMDYQAIKQLGENKGQQKLILVHGVFDMLHQGHVMLLTKAKALGGLLLVGVEPDGNARQIKGPKRPIHDQDARLYVLSHLIPVDRLFLIPSYPDHFNQDQFYEALYRDIKPDIVATCTEAGKHGSLKANHANRVGAQFVDIDSQYDKTTTQTLALLKAV